MRSFLRSVFVAVFIGVLFAVGWAGARQAAPNPDIPPAQQQRLDVMKSKGTETSLTILPVRLAGQPFDRITEVVGLLLEQQGLQNIELSKTTFDPADGADLTGLVDALAGFVKANPVTTDYVLYAEFNGTREAGLKEVRVVVVDKSGAVVWTDIQTPRDQESRNPMALCVQLIQRLGPRMGLNEDTAKAAKPGKMAAIMNQRSGMPPESERAPLPERQKALRESAPASTWMVFPVRVRGDVDPASAADLAKRICDGGLCKAVAADAPVRLKAPQPDPNELKTLWDFARQFRDHARQHPVDADYTLLADYAFNPRNWEQGFVHFVVCDRKGEWVIVDMQNSHHADYQSIKPTSREACDRLLVKRLSGYLARVDSKEE
ncbi:MAG: hypothetical protein FJ276_12450 [Planctomycetes bacterium]|nr:hypothetical protein [Planctomycetota bacterium]